MAGNVMISVEGVSQRRASGKPKLLLRRSRRKAATHLLKALMVLENREYDENRRSAINNYSPFLILGAPNSRYTTALATLKARLQEALAAKA